MFDVSPHVSLLHFLYASARKGTHKPIFVVGGERMTFKYADVVVGKCFDYPAVSLSVETAAGSFTAVSRQGDLSAYAGQVETTAHFFLRSARAMGGKTMLGMPFVATPHEYESCVQKPGDEPVHGGVKMEDYAANALGYIERNVQVNDDAFLGPAIWAIHPAGGVQKADARYFPSEISQDLWQRMKTPLIRR
jgi:hypothetical protein